MLVLGSNSVLYSLYSVQRSEGAEVGLVRPESFVAFRKHMLPSLVNQDVLGGHRSITVHRHGTAPTLHVVCPCPHGWLPFNFTVTILSDSY